MSSLAQILANQANSLKSTGPKTEKGKEASSQNSKKHGLSRTGANNNTFYLLQEESNAKFDELWQQMFEQYDPQDLTEQILVRNMVHHEWLRGRAIFFQHLCFREPGWHMLVTQHFALYLRYGAMHERGFLKCLHELERLREQKKNAQIGFDSQKLKLAASHRAAEALNLRKEVVELQKEALRLQIESKKTRAGKEKSLESSPGALEIAA
jgi:hypothetical protein